MKHLKVCVWVGPPKNQIRSSSQPVQSNLENLVKQGVNIVFQVEDIGVWALFTTVAAAVEFAHAVLEKNETVQHSVLITAGDLQYEEGKWVGYPLERTKSLIRFLEQRQISKICAKCWQS